MHARKLGTIWVVLMMTSTICAPPVTATDVIQEGCERTDLGYRCFYGPIDLSEGRATYDGRVPAPPEMGYITSARAVVVDEYGDRIPRHAIHVHHAGWLNPGDVHLGCGGDHEPIYGTGKEDNKMVYPEGYGYLWDPFDATDPPETAWHMYSRIDVLHEDTASLVYIRLNLGFAHVQDGTLSPVRTIWWGVLGCDVSQEFVILKDSGTDGKVRVSHEFPMPVQGRFIWLTSHVHDGAYRLRLFDLTTNTGIFTSRAEYGHGPWDLTGTTTYSDPEGIAVEKGDELLLRAVYDSTRERDGMGIMRAAIVLP